MAKTYTSEQVDQFLDLLDVPEEYRSRKTIPSLELLRVLHTHMISTIPFETLDLHYKSPREILLDSGTLFQKLVANGRGRGGYCLENNQLLLHMLRALGFDAYLVGAKVRPRKDGVPQGEFMCWVHAVNIVTMADGTCWMVDVAFGGDGPTQPMFLDHGAVTRNLGMQDARLVRDFMPEQLSRNPALKMWMYQARNSENLPWSTYYAFSDAVEWLAPDFKLINRFTGASMESYAVTGVVVVKFLRRAAQSGHEEAQEVYAKRMLVDNVVKENVGGKTQVVQECRSEDQRVAALREWFGMELTDEERLAIRGHFTELI